MAPEYAMEGIFSMKSDVYSFGVLVLEIISGRRNGRLHAIEPSQTLLALVRPLYRTCSRSPSCQTSNSCTLPLTSTRCFNTTGMETMVSGPSAGIVGRFAEAVVQCRSSAEVHPHRAAVCAARRGEPTVHVVGRRHAGWEQHRTSRANRTYELGWKSSLAFGIR